MDSRVILEMIPRIADLIALILTTILIPYVCKLIKSRLNSVVMQNAVDDISNNVNIAVNYIEQTLVSTLKEVGKWDDESKKLVLNKAIDIVKNNVEATTSKYFGDKLTEYITYSIEAFIASKKK